MKFVIVGFTDPTGTRLGFGSLMLGYFKDATLLYAGNVGTGFTHSFLRAFRHKLHRIERKIPTVTLPKGHGVKGIHWVKPELVGEVRFNEWTRDGSIRHPSFVGLRDDRSAKDVRREEPGQRQGN